MRTVPPGCSIAAVFYRRQTAINLRREESVPTTVDVLAARCRCSRWRRMDDPVFASSAGTWLWPNNLRTRLRRAVAGVQGLDGTTPHTLRRTVGTLVAHEVGLDAAREQLGHSDSSVTYQHYVAARRVAPDLRSVLDRFFMAPEAAAGEHGEAGARL